MHYLSLWNSLSLALIARSHLPAFVHSSKSSSRSCQNPGKYFWPLSEFPSPENLNERSLFRIPNFRRLSKSIISFRQSLALVRAHMRKCPLREKEKEREKENRREQHFSRQTSRTQSRAGTFGPAHFVPGLASLFLDDRYASARSRAHARFTTVFSSFVHEWRINGGPFQYSRRHSGSTAIAMLAICMYVCTRRRRLDLQRAFGTNATSVVLFLAVVKQYYFMWNNNDNGVSLYGRNCQRERVNLMRYDV